MNEPGLPEALRTAVAESNQRAAGTTIRLERLELGIPLDSNAEEHLLQITREALANVVSHAGISEHRHHYGIRIMTERAETLGGTLTVTRREPCRTRVEVRFPARTHQDTESSA